jgi:hypothetical protein
MDTITAVKIAEMVCPAIAWDALKWKRIAGQISQPLRSYLNTEPFHRRLQAYFFWVPPIFEYHVKLLWEDMWTMRGKFERGWRAVGKRLLSGY